MAGGARWRDGVKVWERRRGSKTQASAEAPREQATAPAPAIEALLVAQLAGERRGVGEPTALLRIGVDGAAELEAIAGRPAIEGVGAAIHQVLASVVRSTDLMARLDQTSYGVVLAGMDLPGALRMAARLRWAVVKLALPYPEPGSGHVTVSFGVAVECGALEGGGARLMAAAGELLSSAQAAGGDRTEHLLLTPTEGPPAMRVARSLRAGVVSPPVDGAARPLVG